MRIYCNSVDQSQILLFCIKILGIH